MPVTSTSGIAGVLNVGGGGQASNSWENFMEMAMRIKQNQQSEATKQLEVAMDAFKTTGYIDPGLVRKSAKTLFPGVNPEELISHFADTGKKLQEQRARQAETEQATLKAEQARTAQSEAATKESQFQLGRSQAQADFQDRLTKAADELAANPKDADKQAAFKRLRAQAVALQPPTQTEAIASYLEREGTPEQLKAFQDTQAGLKPQQARIDELAPRLTQYSPKDAWAVATDLIVHGGIPTDEKLAGRPTAEMAANQQAAIKQAVDLDLKGTDFMNYVQTATLGGDVSSYIAKANPLERQRLALMKEENDQRWKQLSIQEEAEVGRNIALINQAIAEFPKEARELANTMASARKAGVPFPPGMEQQAMRFLADKMRLRGVDVRIDPKTGKVTYGVKALQNVLETQVSAGGLKGLLGGTMTDFLFQSIENEEAQRNTAGETAPKAQRFGTTVGRSITEAPGTAVDVVTGAATDVGTFIQDALRAARGKPEGSPLQRPTDPLGMHLTGPLGAPLDVFLREYLRRRGVDRQ